MLQPVQMASPGMGVKVLIKRRAILKKAQAIQYHLLISC